MRAIWKFNLQMLQTQVVEMPDRAELLSVRVQHDELMVWALVDPEARKVERPFMLYATGEPLPDGPMGVFVGTVMFQGGDYVFHVYAGA